MNKKEYFIVIERAANNFSAFCPDIPGCIATGITVEKVASKMKQALQFHLEDELMLPEAKSLQQLERTGVFEELDEFYISRVTISLLQGGNTPGKEVSGKVVTFKVMGNNN